MSGGPVYLEKSHLEKQPILMGIWKGGNAIEETTTLGEHLDFKGPYNFATGLTKNILRWIG